nr:reverse transcriptase domain-containing protein [Tanacetum cinerariifolium]
MIDQGVTAALAARDALRSTNGDDSHNSGTGVRRTERAARECTYTDFLKCQPLPFKGTEGVASLSQWCERMESVFHISNCAAENQTVGHEAAYGMMLNAKMKMMTDKYCPRNEIRKLEMELWDLKLKKNNNHGNQGGRNNAPARVYAIGRAGIDPDANVVTGTFLLNNRYASILFDTGADRSFVSTTFSTQINITPSTLDHCYDVELADRRMIGLNTILRGCRLNLLNHPFTLDLMPVELVVSPTAESPGYVADSDLEEDPKEYEDDEREDGSVDYPINGGDDGDDDDGDSFGYNADDEDEDDEEEDDEEHLASADSAIVIPTDELVSPPEGKEPIIPPPSTDTATTRARIAVRL